MENCQLIYPFLFEYNYVIRRVVSFSEIRFSSKIELINIKDVNWKNFKSRKSKSFGKMV